MLGSLPILAGIATCFLPLLTQATTLVTDGSTTRAEITAKLSLDGGVAPQNPSAFDATQRLRLDFTLSPDPDDLAVRRPVYLAGLYNGKWYQMNAARQWQHWDGDLAHLLPFDEPILTRALTVSPFFDDRLPAGEFVVYAGYRNRQGHIVYNAAPVGFHVFDREKPVLQAVHTEVMLRRYVEQAQRLAPEFTAAMPSQPIMADVKTISQTNLQEAGVDEADYIKTHGDQLYLLAPCDTQSSETPTCLSRYQLNDNPASASLRERFNIDPALSVENLYLIPGDTIELIALGNSMPPIYFDIMPIRGIWHEPTVWHARHTDTVFFRQEARLRSTQQIRFDGALLTSRRIGDTLYLVTRFTPTPEQLTPKVTRDGVATPLLQAHECYVAPATHEQIPEASMLVITALPLNDPTSIRSVCVLGPSEAYYLSLQNLYLATTRHTYSPLPGSSDRILYSPEPRTQLHKFALDGSMVTYRGSGEVSGHLGWEEQKKSFRMGEHRDVLRIATSLGEPWNDSESTSVFLLREEQGQLREIGRLEGLGKPGERLYAARFIGDRGYLVTFRLTDPLYVLDLGNPEQPKVAGELSISGYSDYLHPIGEHYLLGLGKDAIADATLGDGRGAWYQGVKLSLFDVRDPNQPKEIDTQVFGRRGTESDALYDHHALAYLPPDDGQPARLALPMRLHDGPAQGDPARADTYYAWQSTGLQLLTIDLDMIPALRVTGHIIAAKSPGQDTYGLLRDRAVLYGDSAHYVHNGAIYSERFEN